MQYDCIQSASLFSQLRSGNRLLYHDTHAQLQDTAGYAGLCSAYGDIAAIYKEETGQQHTQGVGEEKVLRRRTQRISVGNSYGKELLRGRERLENH